jgi:hypothetical protein
MATVPALRSRASYQYLLQLAQVRHSKWPTLKGCGVRVIRHRNVIQDLTQIDVARVLFVCREHITERGVGPFEG